MMPPLCKVTSAIIGLPTTSVATRSGSLTSLAWSTVTAIAGSGSADAAAGHSSSAATAVRYAKETHERQDTVNDILNPGASTSRLKRYAAVTAPDAANLRSIGE